MKTAQEAIDSRDYNSYKTAVLKDGVSNRFRLINGLRLSLGNSKVKWPLFSFESASNCSSRFICKYSKENYQGGARCYAQRDETQYIASKFAHKMQEEQINNLKSEDIKETARLIISQVSLFHDRRKSKLRFMRFSEYGDVNLSHLPLLRAMVRECKKQNIRPYIYTKQAGKVLKALRALKKDGLTTLRSDIDFQVVKTESEQPKGSKLCLGECNPSVCVRCPMGKKSHIVAH